MCRANGRGQVVTVVNVCLVEPPVVWLFVQGELFLRFQCEDKMLSIEFM